MGEFEPQNPPPAALYFTFTTKCFLNEENNQQPPFFTLSEFFDYCVDWTLRAADPFIPFNNYVVNGEFTKRPRTPWGLIYVIKSGEIGIIQFRSSADDTHRMIFSTRLFFAQARRRSMVPKELFLLHLFSAAADDEGPFSRNGRRLLAQQMHFATEEGIFIPEFLSEQHPRHVVQSCQ